MGELIVLRVHGQDARMRHRDPAWERAARASVLIQVVSAVPTAV
jgi:hypothetical protein